MKHLYAVAMAIFSLTKMGQCSKGFSIFCTPTKESVLEAWFLSTWHWWNQSQSVSIPFAPEGAQLYKNWIIKQHVCYTNIYFFLICLPIQKQEEKNSVRILIPPLKQASPELFLRKCILGYIENKQRNKEGKKIKGGKKKKKMEHQIQKIPSRGDPLLPTILVASILCKIRTVISPAGDTALKLMAISHLPHPTFLIYSHYFHLMPSYKFITDS